MRRGVAVFNRGMVAVPGEYWRRKMTKVSLPPPDYRDSMNVDLWCWFVAGLR
jgi:hypothetical protein